MIMLDPRALPGYRPPREPGRFVDVAEAAKATGLPTITVEWAATHGRCAARPAPGGSLMVRLSELHQAIAEGHIRTCPRPPAERYVPGADIPTRPAIRTRTCPDMAPARYVRVATAALVSGRSLKVIRTLAKVGAVDAVRSARGRLFVNLADTLAAVGINRED